MIRGYFKSYFVCLVSLLSLYIVVDLFTNLDDFIHSTNDNENGLAKVVARIVSYYGFRIPQFFDRLCEAIVLLAGMFTVAMMQRNNEQLPLLSAGVSTHRIVAPVIGCACFMMTMTVLNQELIIPRIRHKLALERSDHSTPSRLPLGGHRQEETMSTTSQTQSAAPAQAPLVAANMFAVAGGGLHVSYSTSGIDGKPHLSYQDPMRALSFTGDQIRRVEGDLGAIVSVTPAQRPSACWCRR